MKDLKICGWKEVIVYSLPARDVKEVRRACKLGIISLLPSLTRLVQVLSRGFENIFISGTSHYPDSAKYVLL